jgi:hypothetical protein
MEAVRERVRVKRGKKKKRKERERGKRPNQKPDGGGDECRQ